MQTSSQVVAENRLQLSEILSTKNALSRWWSSLDDHERGALCYIAKIPKKEWSPDWRVLAPGHRQSIKDALMRLAVLRHGYLKARQDQKL